MSAGGSGNGDGPRPRPGADRLTELRAERAERLLRLRGAPAATNEAEPALAEFLSALRAAIEDRPAGAEKPGSMLADAPAAAEVLPFQREPDRAAAARPAEPSAPPAAAPGDLDRLPGVGPGLVWALEQAGIARLADLAASAPAPLADRLGPIGGLIDLSGWIAFARARAAPGTAPRA